ncbi:hypothetical protein STEG23_007259, partial [Scotinomys teguina]
RICSTPFMMLTLLVAPEDITSECQDISEKSNGCQKMTSSSLLLCVSKPGYHADLPLCSVSVGIEFYAVSVGITFGGYDAMLGFTILTQIGLIWMDGTLTEEWFPSDRAIDMSVQPCLSFWLM